MACRSGESHEDAALFRIGPDKVNGDRLPEWAHSPLPDDWIHVVNRWLTAQSWTDREDLIRAAYPELISSSGQRLLGLTRTLYPEIPALAELNALTDAVVRDGLEPVLTEMRDRETHRAQIGEWLATPNWSESFRFARDHLEVLGDPRTSTMLAELREAARDDTSVIDQHLAILELAEGLPLSDIYDMVSDPTAAVDPAMAAVAAGDSDRLTALIKLTPNVLGLRFVGLYLSAVLISLMLAATDRPEEPEETIPDPVDLMRLAGDQASAAQRRAGVIRLRRLRDHRPDLAYAVTGLIAALEAPPEP